MGEEAESLGDAELIKIGGRRWPRTWREQSGLQDVRVTTLYESTRTRTTIRVFGASGGIIRAAHLVDEI